MGLIRCQHHGLQPIALVCEHLRQSALTGSVLDDVFRVEAYYLDVLAGLHYICPECARLNHISQKLTVWRDDESLDRMPAMKSVIAPICSKCFDQAKTR